MTDALGSTVALADYYGSLQTQYTYEPFGAMTVSGTSANPSQYTGRENDGTGLYYYRARYYSPTLQRFLSQDPLEFAGGDVNLYAYAGNDPVDYTDPSGTFIPECALGAGINVVANSLAGRKFTAHSTVHYAVTGCLAGMAGAGLGKAFDAALGRALPQLAGSLAKSFDSGAYTTQTFRAGTVFYRAESASQGVGSFLGFAKPGTAADAEELYNIAKWGNPADVVSTYRLISDTTMYVGGVAGGTGRQAMLPRGIDAAAVLRRIAQESLP